jgi:hypothetical protein
MAVDQSAPLTVILAAAETCLRQTEEFGNFYQGAD